MKLACVLLSTFFSMNLIAAAQQGPSFGVAGMEAAPPGQDAPRAFRLDPNGPLAKFELSPSMACPVGLEARQGMDGSMVQTRNQARPERPGQRIHLVLKKSGIVGATVKVGGLSGRARLAESRSGALEPDIWRTLQVRFTPAGDDSVTGSMKLVGFTSVLSVRLISLTYADGTTWTVPQHRLCTVKPNPMMLVEDR